MSKKEKLIQRMLSRPKDFTFDELVALLGYFGYYIDYSGKTSGSRVSFKNSDGKFVKLHKPHPQNPLKAYQLDEGITFLKEGSII